MKLNFKTLAYFVSGAILIAAPISLIKSSHYAPRFEGNEKNKAQSWAGAAEYYHMLKADPVTGLIDEQGRQLAEQEAMLRMQNTSKSKSNSALGLNWTELGPDNVGGRVRAIVFDKKNQNVIYAGGVSGGIFKSTDGGSTWNPINDQLTNMVVSCMDQDASGANIYFGTGETLGSYPSGNGNSAFIGNGLYKMDLSTNAITSVTSTVTYRDITNVKCHLSDDNVIYLGTDNKGFRISKNAGVTWGTAKLASTSATVSAAGTVIDLKVGTDNSYVYSAGSKVYRSTTGDEFVTEITPLASALADKTSIEIAIAPSDPSVIYLASARGDSKLGGVAQTINGGTSWYKIANASSTTFDPFISGGNGQGQYDNAITVHPLNSGLLYFGGASYWKWEQTSPGIGAWNYAAYQFAVGSQQYVHSDIHAFEWDPFNSSKLIVGSDGGMFRSIDGGDNYTAINKGFNTIQAYAIAFERYPALGLSGFPMGGAACGNQDNGTTYVPGNFNGTKGAYPLGGGDGNFLDFSNIAPDAVFTSIYYGQVNRAANKGAYGGSEFVDVDYGALNGGPGAPTFASFVTPIKLWENSADMNSIDSVWFKAPVISSNSAGTGDGFTKTLRSSVVRTDNSAIFDSLYLTFGSTTTGINYTSPALATKSGTVLTIPETSVTFVLGSYSGTVIASRYGAAFNLNPETDSLKIVFSTAPSNGLVLKTTMTEMFNSGADVKVSTETTSSTKFSYSLPTALAARGKIRLPDIMQARLAIGISNRVVVVKRPLNFGITPDWCTVASDKSRDETGANAAFSGVVQTMEWDPSGDNLYVGTQGGVLYRISHLRSLRDSVFNKSIDSLNANAIDSVSSQRKRSPIRCTKIASFGGNVITSISVDPINGDRMVVTCGTYGVNTKVYYAGNPASHPPASGAGLFVSKMGAGATGLITTAPVYSSLIELGDSKRVIVGTEYGIYATSDITAATPVWTKENNSKLPNVPVFMIRQQTKHSGFCYNSGIIYAGTHGRGIWASDTYFKQSVVGINEIAQADKTQVNGIKLYPNPTRDMVNLSFNIAKSENLTLSVYDLKGVLVITKNLGKLPEGEQLMQIGTEDLISGTYIVSLNSSNAIVGTSRLVVIK